jgi:hypothetical protein
MAILTLILGFLSLNHKIPTPEKMEEVTEEMLRQTLVIGADGVMVPFRPQKGSRKGKTVWREVKVGILARLKQHRTGSAVLWDIFK